MPIRIEIRRTALLSSLVFAACGGTDAPVPAAEPMAEPMAEPAAAETRPASDLVRSADPAARGYTPDDFPRVQELASGVYSYEHLTTESGETLATVSLFVVTDGGVLVADGQGSPEATRSLVEHIAGVTDQPIATVVLASNSAAHNGGNSAFPTGVTYVAHPATASELGVDAQAVPDQTTLTLGGRDVRVMHMGAGHGEGDLFVFVPDARVAYLGDAFGNRVFPQMRTAYPSSWVDELNRASTLRASIYVPGRGFVDPPAVLAEELNAFRAAVETIVELTSHPFSEGGSVDDALLVVDLGALSEWALAESGREVAIRRSFADVAGDL